ncbi:hypothetical protein DOTSEDRAFT_168506 [Dothistroma septosporum NZE10]|uniref:Protein kinase domain-containing protein n=1 Tax=Dothistroma septosporum (strain NZE10 / CBS 128990) TaxID=675120 RepID=N1PUX2_DOTSN|nr:hypothetical protein DOTSEDRAFT_168506 [Dothistroma septosporum NZE10]
MASRNYAQVAPTAATIALNAYIFGYGGHSLVTPHAALKQLWWTKERIDAKVTRPFVVSKLRGEEREFLNRPLAFGEGLTDDTYMEWILERAKRLFLILTEIGVPDQIFGCIDDSWDDDDLPVPLENVPNLELSHENNEALNKKFYDMQFVYLLRELKQNSHVDYGPKEHIPMEHVNVLPPAVCLQPYDRVHFPGRPDDVFMRRKFSLTDRDTGAYHGETFMRDVKKAIALSHEHVATTWASYTSEDAGFVLSDFVAEHTLGTFIEHRTSVQFLRVNPSERPILLMEWMHCLADTLASLHHRGVAHGQIRPSNIWINKQNKIAFADVGTLVTFQRNKKTPKMEAYDYAAPEQSITRIPVTVKTTPPPVSSMNAFNRLRQMSMQSISDTSSSTSAEMSDIFSLACVFLDILTFMLKGKITDFVKFRSTRIPVPSKNKIRTDTSFHSEPDKIAEWIGTLEEDSYRHGEPIFRGVPEMLRLVRTMMMQNATLRPTAVEVRDRIYSILLDECSIETLCCAGREWAEIKSDEEDDGSTKSPFRRERDEMSVATGLLRMPSKKENDAIRCTSSCGELAARESAERMSVSSRTESNLIKKTRRKSSASTATARLSSWRSRFLRSS